MQNQVTIHRPTPDHWERVRAIRLSALENSPDAFSSTLDQERRLSDSDWMNRQNHPGVATFVASSPEENDVGLVTAAPCDQFLGLYSMWVAPEARGTGVGGALVDAVIEWAIQQEHSKILLDVGENNAPAIALYKSRGFMPTGIVSTFPPPREHIREHQRALIL